MASVEASTELDHILHSSNLDIDNRHTLFFNNYPLRQPPALRKIAVLEDLKRKRRQQKSFFSQPPILLLPCGGPTTHGLPCWHGGGSRLWRAFIEVVGSWIQRRFFEATFWEGRFDSCLFGSVDETLFFDHIRSPQWPWKTATRDATWQLSLYTDLVFCSLSPLLLRWLDEKVTWNGVGDNNLACVNMVLQVNQWWLNESPAHRISGPIPDGQMILCLFEMFFCSPLNAIWRLGLTLSKAWSALASKSGNWSR